jgi:hypothetical protein
VALGQANGNAPNRDNVGFRVDVSPIYLHTVEVGGMQYGSGQIVTVTVTPTIPGFHDTVVIDALGALQAPLTAPPFDMAYCFYDPQNPPVNPLDRPTSVSVAFQQQAGIPPARKVYMEADIASDFAGYTEQWGLSYWGVAVEGEIGGNPNRNSTSQVRLNGSDLTAPASAAWQGGDALGPYYKGETAAGYDAMQDLSFTLPATDPAVSQIVTYYNHDAAYIYSGGDAVDPVTLHSTALDCGFQLGHTGNFGWAPFCRYNHHGSGSVAVDPVLGGNDKVREYQGTLTFAAPGYTEPEYGMQVPDYAVWVMLPTAVVSDDNGATFGTVADDWYVYHLPNTTQWTVGNDFRLKYTNSIAQDAGGYNAPPSPPARKVELYASGSRVQGGGWGRPLFHAQGDLNTSFNGPPLVDVTKTSSPGSPYVASSGVLTLGQ